MNKTITVETIVNAPMEKVWDAYTNPNHITKWAFASDDWEAPYAENDIQTGGRFKTTMAAKDKSAQFDFEGVYTNVIPNQVVEYDMSDKRHAKITFEQTEGGVKVTTTFDPESQNPEEMQRGGWQAISDNFKNYTESLV